MVGTPAMIADQMQEWLESEARDGFNVMFPYLPAGLDDFVERVVPELQRRGIFRRRIRGGRCGRIWGCRGWRTGFLGGPVPIRCGAIRVALRRLSVFQRHGPPEGRPGGPSTTLPVREEGVDGRPSPTVTANEGEASMNTDTASK